MLRTYKAELAGQSARCFFTTSDLWADLVSYRLENEEGAPVLLENLPDGRIKVTSAIEGQRFKKTVHSSCHMALELEVWEEIPETRNLKEWGILFSRYLGWQEMHLGKSFDEVEFCSRDGFNLDHPATEKRWKQFLSDFSEEWEMFAKAHKTLAKRRRLPSALANALAK